MTLGRVIFQSSSVSIFAQCYFRRRTRPQVDCAAGGSRDILREPVIPFSRRPDVLVYCVGNIIFRYLLDFCGYRKRDPIASSNKTRPKPPSNAAPVSQDPRRTICETTWPFAQKRAKSHNLGLW